VRERESGRERGREGEGLMTLRDCCRMILDLELVSFCVLKVFLKK